MAVSFKDIIEQYGKQISVKTTHCRDIGTVRQSIKEYTSDDLQSVNLRFDGALYTSVMRCCDVAAKGDRTAAIKKGDVLAAVTLTAKDAAGNTAAVDYGDYIVAEAPEYDADADSTKIICYDNMYKAMRPYSLTVTFPITLENYLKAICRELGFNFNFSVLANRNMTINEDVYSGAAGNGGTPYTFRDVLDEIARCAGCSFAFKSNANGEDTNCLYSVYVTDGYGGMKSPKYTLDISNFKSLTIGESYGAANTVIFSRQPQEDNVYLMADGVSEATAVAVKLTQPELADSTDDGERAAWLPQILNSVKGTRYYCYSFESFGMGCLNFGDVFKIKSYAKQGKTIDYNAPAEYQTVFMRSDIMIDTDIKESSKLEMPVAASADYRAATAGEKQLKRAFLKVDKQLGEITSLVSDPESGLATQVKQSAEGIKTIATKVENIKIGSRNILIDSACFESRGLSAYYVIKEAPVKGSDAALPSGEYTAYSFTSSDTNIRRGIRFSNAPAPVGDVKSIKPGTAYTFTFWAKLDAGTKALSLSDLVGVSLPKTNAAQSLPELTAEWRRFVYTFTTGEGINEYFQLCFYFPMEAGETRTLYLSSLQLEESTVPSDWHKSDADYKNYADSAGEAAYSRAESYINQQADSITIAVEKSIVIGARNLLKDSACFEETEFSFKSMDETNASQRVITYPQLPSGKAKKFGSIVTAAGAGVYQYNLVEKDKLIAGKTYTLSFWAAKGNNSVDFQFSLKDALKSLDANGITNLIKLDEERTVNPVPTLEFQRYSATFKIEKSLVNDVCLSFLTDCGSGSLSFLISSVKLEAGNVATDWSTAEEEYATKAALKMVDDSIVGTVESSLNGGICTSVRLDKNGMTVENGALTIKDANGEITIDSGRISGDKIAFGKQISHPTVNASNASEYNFAPLSAWETQIKPIPELWNYYSADKSNWLYMDGTTNSDAMLNIHAISDTNQGLTIDKNKYYTLSLDYIAYSYILQVRKPQIIFNISDSMTDPDRCRCFTGIYPDYKSYTITGTNAVFKDVIYAYGTHTVTVKGDKLLPKEATSMPNVFIAALLLNDCQLPGMEPEVKTLAIGDSVMIAIKDVKLTEISGASLVAGAVLNSNNEYFFDFDNGIVNCNFLRAGRTQISFEAWSSSQVSMAMRDVICSDGGFVLSANGGKNALYLQGNQINIVSLQSSSGSDSWKPLIYNTETGEMRYKV